MEVVLASHPLAVLAPWLSVQFPPMSGKPEFNATENQVAPLVEGNPNEFQLLTQCNFQTPQETQQADTLTPSPTTRRVGTQLRMPAHVPRMQLPPPIVIEPLEIRTTSLISDLPSTAVQTIFIDNAELTSSISGLDDLLTWKDCRYIVDFFRC